VETVVDSPEVEGDLIEDASIAAEILQPESAEVGE
jgi:hypothetical protein